MKTVEQGTRELRANESTRWQADRLPPGRRGVAGLLHVLGGHRRAFALSVLFGALNQASGIAANVLGAVTVVKALTGTGTGTLWWLAAATLGLVVLRAVATWLEAWISHELSFRILADVRQWLYWAFERIAPGGLVRARTGDLASRTLHDSESLEIFYAHTSIYIALAATLPPVALVALAFVDPRLALVLLPWLVASASVPLWLRSRGRRQGRRVRELTARINVEVVDLVQGLRETVSFGAGERRLADLAAAGDRLARAQHRQAARGGLETAAGGLLVSGGTLAVLGTGVWLVSRDALPVEWLAPAVVLAAGAFGPITTLLNVTRVWGITSSAADRVFDVLETPAPVPDDGRITLPPDPGPLEIVFEGVGFRYADDGPWVLDGVDLTVPAGTTVALAGVTGAGKSTLAHLLLRWFDPQRGRITLGGVDLRDLPREELTRLVGHVPQDVFLFHDTLAANLELAAPGAGDARLRRACDDARVTPFLERLPDGADTVVGERGARLSGGERQRVAVARALLKDSPVLVLDESSSQLDVLSEREVQTALERVRAGRTTLVIAHRLSTLRGADLVAVLDQGRIADVGSHADLLARCAPYRSLVQAQADAAALLAAGAHG
ncbi:MAG TPA: ABC transporter ATP-binding protein, partial [Thermomonospora sp.]|nr:ABC transporter ATP-binding protein [Thermomonospora sp.]